MPYALLTTVILLYSSIGYLMNKDCHVIFISNE